MTKPVPSDLRDWPCSWPPLASDAAPLAAELELRPPRLADMPWLRNSFAEGHKDAPGVSGMSWRHYKLWIVPQLRAALASADLIAAYLGPDIVGWIALNRGRRADTVHWIHTRWRVGIDGEVLRRRGIATALLDAAQLKQHLAYTFRGAQPKHREHAGAPMDERLLPWLRARGHHAAYLPWEEWNQ